jgi:RNA polymerase sigma factor (TIGR02999 family)
VRSAEPTQRLIVRWQGGEHSARDTLIARLYPELAQIAAARLRREGNCSLSTGDLINDAMLRLLDGDPPAIRDRPHLTALASRIMRNVLVDHARTRNAGKRRHQRVELNTSIDGQRRFDLEELDVALVRLGAIDHTLMELVEMRYFGGMSIEEAALATGWSEPTVKRRWQTARAWLLDALANPLHDD